VGWDEILPYFDQFSPVRNTHPGRVVFRWTPTEGRADWGTAITSVYWLSELAPRDASARWSRLDVSSGGNPEPDHTLAYTDVTETLLTTTDRVVTQSWVPTGTQPARTQTLTMDLTNLGHMTVDLSRTGLRSTSDFSLNVTSDGATTIELDNILPGSTATIGGVRVAVAHGSSIIFQVPAGQTTVVIGRRR
jgi:hypothetical protein